MAAGTFRTYAFVYSGTISGLPTTGTNRKNVLWRVRWITKLRSTYQSLYVFIDTHNNYDTLYIYNTSTGEILGGGSTNVTLAEIAS